MVKLMDIPSKQTEQARVIVTVLNGKAIVALVGLLIGNFNK